jgi:hypothetical protein
MFVTLIASCGGATVGGDGIFPIGAIANTTAQKLTLGTAMTSFSPLAASGGTPPYIYSVTSGTLPAGLSLDTSTGAVSGTPTATFTVASVVFSVKDANGVVASTSSTVSFYMNTLTGGAIQGLPLNLAGQVSSFTGVANSAMGTGSLDGAAASSTFYSPTGITTDGINLYVADSANNKIRQIVIATGEVTTLAGSGSVGAADGTGIAATFNFPLGITTDGTNLFVTEHNNKIRQIVIATGVVSSFTGTANTQMLPSAADGAAASARFYSPNGITTDGTNLYVVDEFNNKIRQIVISSGVVSSFTGTANTAMNSGAADGAAASATFSSPLSITTDGSNLYVTDQLNYKIRKIVISSKVVSSFTGTANTVMGFGAADGAAASATFNGPRGITTDGTNLYLEDSGKIRKIVISSGVVSSLTGTSNTAMNSGAADGAASSATFNGPFGITTDGTSLYVTDEANNKIRQIK